MTATSFTPTSDFAELAEQSELEHDLPIHEDDTTCEVCQSKLITTVDQHDQGYMDVYHDCPNMCLVDERVVIL